MEVFDNRTLRLTPEQVKARTGCTHVINGYFFNGKFQPLGWTVIDGKIISRDAYQDWGISAGSDGKPPDADGSGRQLSFRGASFEKRGEAEAKPDAGRGPSSRADSCGMDAGWTGADLVRQDDPHQRAAAG